MKCTLTSTCKHKHRCCNFCRIKCDVRCNDDHTDCQWFIDEEEEEQ